jgi:DNA-binding transcriptional ArsR family regulator
MSPPDDPLEVSPDSYQLIKGYFLGQKVPFRMMKTAMILPGKGPFCVYMALWVLYSATRRRKIILHIKFLEDSGLAASTISSALNRLVDAGLISQIKRGVGQAPVIYLKKESEVYED